MKQLLITIAVVVLVGCGESRSIHNAASDGDIEAVKKHLAAGANVNALDSNRQTPLHHAVNSYKKETAEFLIAKGADLNAIDDAGWTPLHLAAWFDMNEIAKLLIAKGADVNAKAVNGPTPLGWATNYGSPLENTQTVDLLRKHGGKTGEELKAEVK